MKKVKFIISVFLFAFLFYVSSNAQPLCGFPSVNLRIRDTQDKSVKNAEVEVEPLGIDDTLGTKFIQNKNDPSVFRIDFGKRFQVKGKYKLIVRAKGFETAEERIEFKDCVSRTVYLLSKKQKIAEVNGTIFDKNKMNVLKRSNKFIFINTKGVVLKATSDEYGKYRIRLPYGKYRVETFFWLLDQYFMCRNFTVDKKEIEFDIYLWPNPVNGFTGKEQTKDCQKEEG